MTMPQTIEIRRLRGDDQALLAAMNAMFAAAFGEPQTYAEPPDAAWSRRVLDSEHIIALAALEGGEVLGGLIAYELDKLERARREVYLYDLAVAEAQRRRGIATRLIDALRTIARERGAWVVFVQADHGDDPAIALYTKLGVREDVLHFDLPLD